MEASTLLWSGWKYLIRQKNCVTHLNSKVHLGSKSCLVVLHFSISMELVKYKTYLLSCLQTERVICFYSPLHLGIACTLFMGQMSLGYHCQGIYFSKICSSCRWIFFWQECKIAECSKSKNDAFRKSRFKRWLCLRLSSVLLPLFKRHSSLKCHGNNEKFVCEG